MHRKTHIILYFFDPKPTESPTEIAINNMKEADQYLNLNYFIASSSGWLNANPSKNYQDLEKKLIAENFNTHIIARNVNGLPEGTKLGLPLRPDDKTKYKYEAIISCRPSIYSIEELLTHSSSIEENLSKLPLAGNIICIPKQNPLLPKEEFEILSEEMSNIVNLITKNLKKIKFLVINDSTVI